MPALFDTAQQLLGKPYVFGGGRGGDTSSCDCSSYVSACFAAEGISLPAFTDAIADVTTMVGTDLSQALPGDLILYRYNDVAQPGTRYPHVAIYAGNGQTYECRFPMGSITGQVLNLPFEVHRVTDGSPVSADGDGATGVAPVPGVSIPSFTGVMAWIEANPLPAAAIVAAFILLTR